jgi:hypothetical protein
MRQARDVTAIHVEDMQCHKTGRLEVTDSTCVLFSQQEIKCCSSSFDFAYSVLTKLS